uniref:Uncharacterized protein n=1 Tax=Grammatophora oceanica TaxID=210454 RepID=A0A7S1VJC5_9STRA
METCCYLGWDQDESAIETEKLFLLAWLWAHRIGPFDFDTSRTSVGDVLEVDWERALVSLALVEDVEDPPWFCDRGAMEREIAEENIRAIASGGLFRVASVADVDIQQLIMNNTHA